MEDKIYWHPQAITDDPSFQNVENAAMVIRCRATDLNRPVLRATAAICAEHNIVERAREKLMSFLKEVTSPLTWEVTDEGELAAAATIVGRAGYAPIPPETIREHSPTMYHIQCVDKRVVAQMELFKLYSDADVVVDCDTEDEFAAYQFIALQHYNTLAGRTITYSTHKDLTDSTTYRIESAHEIPRLLGAAHVFVYLVQLDLLADLIYAMAGRADHKTIAATFGSLENAAKEAGVLADEYVPPIVREALGSLGGGAKFLNDN